MSAPKRVLDLRIGKVLSVEEHPNADKLRLLTRTGNRLTLNVVKGLRKTH